MDDAIISPKMPRTQTFTWLKTLYRVTTHEDIIFQTGTLITKCQWWLRFYGQFFFRAIEYLIFLSPHLTTHFLYLKILTKVTSDLPWHEMHGKLCKSLWDGEASLNPNFSTQEHKEKNTCTGFHISLLHILMSLLTDSNNQDTRIHTAASSTSFLQDSSYWFLIMLPSWSLKQARERSGNIQEKGGRKRWLQADPSTQEVSPWLKRLVRLSISQHISKRLQGFPNFRITTQQRGTVKLHRSVWLNWTLEALCSLGKVKSNVLSQEPDVPLHWSPHFLTRNLNLEVRFSSAALYKDSDRSARSNKQERKKEKKEPTNHHSLEEQLPGRISEILCPKVFQLPFKILSHCILNFRISLPSKSVSSYILFKSSCNLKVIEKHTKNTSLN